MERLENDEVQTIARLARLPEGRLFVAILERLLREQDAKSRRHRGGDLLISIGEATALDALIHQFRNAERRPQAPRRVQGFVEPSANEHR